MTYIIIIIVAVIIFVLHHRKYEKLIFNIKKYFKIEKYLTENKIISENFELENWESLLATYIKKTDGQIQKKFLGDPVAESVYQTKEKIKSFHLVEKALSQFFQILLHSRHMISARHTLMVMLRRAQNFRLRLFHL